MIGPTLPLQITAHDITLAPEMEADIRARVADLARYYDRIMSCRVTVDVPNLRHRQGGLYYVRLDFTVPGGELVIRRRPYEDLRTAIQIAFNAARRRLQDYARRHRGAVKRHAAAPVARVSQYYPIGRYGFLETADGREIYFDAHSVVDGGFDRLDVGMEVRFTEEPGERGPQASSVIPQRHHQVQERE